MQRERIEPLHIPRIAYQRRFVHQLEKKKTEPEKSGRTGQGIHTVSLDPDRRSTAVDFIESSIDVDELPFPHHYNKIKSQSLS